MRLMKIVFAFVLFASLPLAACKAETVDLKGTSWTLEAVEGKEVTVQGQLPTMEFSSEGRVGGNAGCNRYNGAVTIEGDKITFGPAMMTRMACLDEGRMQLEAAFSLSLEKIAGWRVEEQKLILADAGGAEVLRLKKSSL